MYYTHRFVVEHDAHQGGQYTRIGNPLIDLSLVPGVIRVIRVIVHTSIDNQEIIEITRITLVV